MEHRQINLPVACRIAILPFGDLGWDRFEQFGHDMLLALPGMRPGTAHRYGTLGQKQRGIDLIVQREDGQWWAFSSKRYRKYQPHHVREHIAETTYKADRYFMLISGEASTDVRDEVRNHSAWEMWDAEDLSQQVRLELPPEVARRLVDHHFGPIWRRDFLGLPAVGAFLPPTDYFRPFLNGGRLFHHDIPLVGRQALLDDLVAFGNAGQERVLVLPGRGGIGKSRVLREWADRLDAANPDWAVRFLNDGVPVSLEALDDLPSVPSLVAVDDAHRRTDLGPLLAWLRQRPDGKLLLATRPQGVDYLLAELTRAGFDTLQIRRLPPVERLSKAEVRQLAAHVLGPEQGELVDQLTQATRDCPLVTVVGGRLLAMRAVHPELLERDGDFRQEVLTRFRDETLGRVSDHVAPELGRRLLELTAALAPVPTHGGQFHERMAAFLNADAVEVTRALGELERVGLLVRRGNALRVVPDVLADHVLAVACLTPQGAATGFADRLFAAFAADCLSQLLRNLAELDWRVRVDSGDESPLLDRVWQGIREGFRAAGHRDRAELLSQLRDSAYFLPARVLELVRYAVSNPASADPEEVFPGYFSYNHENVVRAVPELLRRCAYSPECLPSCLDLLWELDRNEDPATNPNADPPFRVIKDLAGYQSDKPIWVYRAVLEAVSRWLRCPDAWYRQHTPLDVLDPLLEKSGIEHEADGHQMRMRAFHLLYQSLRELRESVLDTLEQCLRCHDLRVILRTVRSLGDGLNGPMAYLGMDLTDYDLGQWQPEQLRILDLFGHLIEDNPPPVVALAVLGKVRHQARYSRLDAVRERAAALVGSIDRSFDFRLTQMLLPEMSRWDLFEEDDGPGSVHSHEERRRAFALTIATDFWEQFPDPVAAVAEIDRRVQEIVSLVPKCDTAYLAWWLFEAKPEAVQPFLRHLLGMPESPVAHCLNAGLVHLYRTGAAVAAQFARQALDTGVAVFRHAVAHYVAWDLRGDMPLHEEEVELVRTLLTDPDPGVRSTAVGGLRRVAVFRPREALDMATGVDVSMDSQRIVIELCRFADPHWKGCPDAFTDEDVYAFLAMVEGMEDIVYEVVPFLRFACGRAPHAVVEMLIRRIERQERDGYQSGYSPVPFNALHDTFSGLVGSDRHRELLCHVRDYSLGKEGLALLSLADLYRDVSLGYGPAGIEVLSDWLLNGDRERVETAAALLDKAPSRYVFDHLELVGHALDRADTLGEDCLRRVAGNFYKIATGGMRRGTPGQPYPQDIALRDRCLEALLRFSMGSPAYRLLQDVLRKAERDIEVPLFEDDDD